MTHELMLKTKQVLLRILKEYKILTSNKVVYKKLWTCFPEYRFLDKNFSDWEGYDGGYVRYYKAQLELAYICYLLAPNNEKIVIKLYISELLQYIVTEYDITTYGDEDDEDSRLIRESDWYNLVNSEIND